MSAPLPRERCHRRVARHARASAVTSAARNGRRSAAPSRESLNPCARGQRCRGRPGEGNSIHGWRFPLDRGLLSHGRRRGRGALVHGAQREGRVGLGGGDLPSYGSSVPIMAHRDGDGDGFGVLRGILRDGALGPVKRGGGAVVSACMHVEVEMARSDLARSQ